MADYTFELGFDWNMPARGSAIGVLYALQLSLVDNGANGGAASVVSPANLSAALLSKTVDFRVYDVTAGPAPSGGSPQCLQVLFTTAALDPIDGSPLIDDFTPLEGKLAQLTLTAFTPIELDGEEKLISVAYGAVTAGWTVQSVTYDAANGVAAVGNSAWTLSIPGRFELRTMATVTKEGSLARYYEDDPEVIVGEGGSGGGPDFPTGR